MLYRVNYMVHRGAIVEKAVRRSGYSLTRIAKALEISRTTLCNRFKTPNLSGEFINKVGKLIHYDFTIELPTLKKDADFTENHAVMQIEAKYLQLLEKYNHLLELILKWAKDSEAIHIRGKLIELLGQETEEK